MSNKKYEFLVPSKGEYLGAIRKEITGIFETENVDKDLSFKLVLCIDEAVTNSMEHAHQWNEELKVKILLNIKKDLIKIKIYDQGAHEFNPFERKEIDLDEHKKKKKKRGLGWHIIKNVMDDIKYKHLEHGNLLVLTKTI
jgi:anti-sigma regulatory factor (Ser/Thr protein kinase)